MRAILNTKKKRDVFWFYVFLTPGLIGLCGLTLYPIVRALYLSFTNRTLLGFEDTVVVGIANYVRAFKDPYVWESLQNSLVFAFFSVIISNVVGLLTAMLLTFKVKGIKVFRALFYLPSIIPSVASIIMFGFIFSPSSGVINGLLKTFGVADANLPLWLMGSETALTTMILMSFWGFGGKMVIYLAGLMGIPKDLYEAADLDGANKWQKFWHITFTQLMPVIFYNVMMSIIGSIQIFTEAYVLSGSGTGYTVNFYMLNLYTHAYSGDFNLGYASALAWILFVVILVISGIYYLINKLFFNYDK